MYAPEFGIYLFLSLYFLGLVIFFTGLFAVTFSNRSLVLILLGLELMLLGISLLALITAKLTGNLTGQLALFLFLVLAGGESGIGLALVMLYYHRKGSVLLKDISDLKY